jgi:hypothetical protein
LTKTNIYFHPSLMFDVWSDSFLTGQANSVNKLLGARMFGSDLLLVGLFDTG